MVMVIGIEKGESLDKMNKSATLRLEGNIKTAKATTVRDKLNSMKASDRFVSSQGYPVEKEDEDKTTVNELIVEASSAAGEDKKDGEKKDGEKKDEEKKDEEKKDGETDRSTKELPRIRILTKEKKERKQVELGEWPTKPEFWQSDVMNDIELPPTKEDMIVKPGGAADLGAFLDWNKFGLAQWVELIKNNNLLSGVRMDQAYGPTPSAYPLVKAPPSLDKFYTYRNPNAYIDSQTTYSMRDSKYISQGWAKASLSVGTPFVSAAAEASYQQMSSKHTVGKKIFTTAKYKYGFVTIVMDPKDMEPSDKFTTAIKEAVKRSSEDEKKEALKDVFKKFGHSFQTEVTLGGVLVSTESTTTTATMTEEKFEAELKAKLSGAAGAGLYSASAAAAGGFSKDVMEKAMEQQQRLTITAKGGNPLLSSAIGSWIPSVADYRTWRIIDVRSAVSVTEFIRDADLKTQVEKLTAADPQAQARPLRGRWVQPVEYKSNAQGDATNWFRTYRPQVGEDGWYWLGPSLNSRWALIVRENIPDNGALCPIATTTLIHTNTGASKAKDDESFWRLHPSSTEYVALGNIFQSRVTTDGSFKSPDLGSEELKTLRGVRRDLCQRATIMKEPFWTNTGESGSGWVSVFRPEGLPNKPSSEDPRLFYTFQNAGDSTHWETNANSEIWMLRSDAIYIEPWE